MNTLKASTYRISVSDRSIMHTMSVRDRCAACHTFHNALALSFQTSKL